MGLHDDITNALADSFSTDLADAVDSFSGVRVVDGSYNPITDTTSQTTVNYDGRGVFGEFNLKEIDNALILRTDIKLICLQNEVILSGDGTHCTPKIYDKINGYKVINVKQDPAKVSFIIQLRLT